MKAQISLILFLTSLSICFSQSTENNPAQLKKTKVLSITVMGSSLDEFGNPDPIRSKKEYRKYNKNGFLTQEIKYDKNSAIVSNTSFAYTKKGKINKQLGKDKNGLTVKKQICSFDENGNKVNCSGTANAKNYSINYTYDNDNNQITRKKEFENGDIAFDCIKTYSNNLLSTETFKGPTEVKIEYQYDSIGNNSEKYTYANNALSFRYTYEYNKDNNVVTETKYDANNVILEKLEYEYVDSKLIKSISKFNAYGYQTMQWLYFYNEKDNIYKININEGDKKTPLYQSEYIYKYYTH